MVSRISGMPSKRLSCMIQLKQSWPMLPSQTMVTVNPAAKGAFGIVEVHAAQILKADDTVEVGKGLLAGFGAPQVVAGGKGVAGIDADADTGFIFHAIDDGREMLELKAEVAALAGGVFDHGGDAFGLGQRDIDRFGDARQALLLRDLLQMAAGVEVEQRQPQLLAAGHLIDEGITGFFQRFFHRMAEVNQVAVVRQDLPGAKVILFTGGFEFGDGLVAERRGAPLALVFGEEGEGGCFDFGGANGGIGQST